ncbi:MAG: hypothetical protein QOI49_778 [Verrucomicrobiota bacterium]|jgi:hypothetical protein
MKRLITYSAAVFLAMTVIGLAGADEDAIQTKEKAAWQAFKDKKGDDFKKVVDKDFRGVYAESIANMDTELADMKKWEMKSFAISAYKTFSDEKDVIVATYVVKLEGTYDGKDASGTFNAGSVWKKEGSDWLAIFHTNVKQEAAAKK